MKEFCHYGYPTFLRENSAKGTSVRNNSVNFELTRYNTWFTSKNSELNYTERMKRKHFFYFTKTFLAIIRINFRNITQYEDFYLDILYDHENQFVYSMTANFGGNEIDYKGFGNKSVDEYFLFDNITYDDQLFKMLKGFHYYKNINNESKIDFNLVLSKEIYPFFLELKFLLKTGKLITYSFTLEKLFEKEYFKIRNFKEKIDQYKEKYKEIVESIHNIYRIMMPYCKAETEEFLSDVLVKVTRQFKEKTSHLEVIEE